MKSNSQRLESLDALRGFDMMFIMGVASLVIAVCGLFPAGADCWLVRQMGHTSWNGLTHHDTIFPLFIFLAGVSWPFSLAKQRAAGKSTGKIVGKILTRAITLIVLGIIYNGFFRLDFTHLRVASVLGRIGLAWMFAAWLFMACGWKWRAVIAAVILIGYNLLLLIPAPDAAGAGSLTLEGNIVGYVDRILMPNHLLKPGVFDPEGLLSTFPAIVTAMLGQFTGEFVKDSACKRKTLWMVVAAAVLLVVGLVWSLWFPINKKLWSSTFTLVAGAYSVGLFALFYWLIDVKGWKKWTPFFSVIGMNSITIYMIQRIVSFKDISAFFLGGVAGLMPKAWGTWLLAIGYFALSWLLLWFLYKKKIFLKV